ncbi:MAG TPA: type II toxin-antitoxin system VapC family toxin [Pseudomonadota bacterium]|jgi:predicted nucleic-acid-binding protein|nr:type II toxin-antitoxin system VapC family toxin [Pseudomonadota bacterium]
MASLDTNLLVRLLVADDAAQLREVEALIRSVQRRGDTLFVPITVALELEWVLRSRYGFAKTNIVDAFNALLETREIEFQFEAALEEALHAFKANNADFSDCLHVGLSIAAEQAPLLTFDARASRLSGASMLGG